MQRTATHFPSNEGLSRHIKEYLEIIARLDLVLVRELQTSDDWAQHESNSRL